MCDPTEPPAIKKPTPDEIREFELRDEINIAEDIRRGFRGDPNSGGDVRGFACPRREIAIDGAPAEPVDRLAELQVARVIRTGRRYLGRIWGPPRDMPEVAAMPLPKGLPPLQPLSLRRWRNATLPDTGWRAVGPHSADGIEACCRCARTLATGYKFVVAANDACDVTLALCPKCADRMCSNFSEWMAGDESPIIAPPAINVFCDPEMWIGTPDGEAMTLDLSLNGEADCNVTLLVAQGEVQAEMEMPDFGGEVEVLGTFDNHGSAVEQAFAEFKHWERR